MNLEHVIAELKRANNWGIEPTIPYSSVYKIIDQYVKPFETEEVAKRVAKKNNKTIEDVLNEWEFSRKWGSIKGIIIHNELAKIFGHAIGKNEDEVYDFLSILNAKQLEEFQYHINTIKRQAEDFAKTNKHLQPVRSEFWVADPEYGIRGIVDQLMYNTRNDQLEPYDWKSNKNFRFQPYNKWNPEMFLGSLSYLPKTDSNYYGLQLNLYKKIIERNSDLKLGNCKIVWFNEHNPKALTISIPNMEQQINTILTERKNFEK